MKLLRQKITNLFSGTNKSNQKKNVVDEHDIELQKVLGAFGDNEFWSSDNNNFMHSYSNLLEQFASPKTLEMLGKAAGSFDFNFDVG